MKRGLKFGLAAALLAALICAPAALGAWSSPGSGSAYAKARTMPGGNTPATTRSNRSVTVSWAQSSFSGGPAVGGYVVKRYLSGGAVQTIGSACNVTITGLTCTETGVPAGTWRYSVTPRQALWAGAESTQSAAVTVPAPTLTLTNTTPATAPATLAGTIANFTTGQTVTYRLDNPTTGTILTGSITPSPVPASGSATVSVTVPAGTTPGSHTIYAVGSGGDSAARAITLGPAFVKNVGVASCSATSLSVTVPAAGVAAANTVILRLALRGTTAGAITASDTRGNTYTVDQDVLNGNQRVAIVRARVLTALTSGNTITVTFPSATTSGLVADEYTRIASATPVDVTGTGSGTGTTPAASLTTTNGYDLLVGAVSISSVATATQPSGWTASTGQSLSCGAGNNATNVGGRRLTSATGAYTYNPVVSASGTWAAAAVAYRGG